MNFKRNSIILKRADNSNCKSSLHGRKYLFEDIIKKKINCLISSLKYGKHHNSESRNAQDVSFPSIDTTNKSVVDSNKYQESLQKDLLFLNLFKKQNNYFKFKLYF